MNNIVFARPDLSDLVFENELYAIANLDDLEIESGYDPQIAAQFEDTFAKVERGSQWDSHEIAQRKQSVLMMVLAALVSIIRTLA